MDVSSERKIAQLFFRDSYIDDRQDGKEDQFFKRSKVLSYEANCLQWVTNCNA